MAGLGKYKKGAKFTLKSGNKPAFKVMGSSPIQDNVGDWEHTGKVQHRKDGSHAGSPTNLNNFGIGQGGSPWKQEDNDDESTDKTTENTIDEQGGDAKTADKAWVKALKTGTTLLSGGIQGVYGGKREYPKINYGEKTKKVTTTPEDGVKTNITSSLGKDKTSTVINNKNVQNGEETSSSTSDGETFDWKNEDGTYKTVQEYDEWYDNKNK